MRKGIQAGKKRVRSEVAEGEEKDQETAGQEAGACPLEMTELDLSRRPTGQWQRRG